MEKILVDVRTLKNGTKTIKNSNGTLMYECQYCSDWFFPKRRFIQKYCCNSCRNMAFNQHKIIARESGMSMEEVRGLDLTGELKPFKD
jgi:hypothetical protein